MLADRLRKPGRVVGHIAKRIFRAMRRLGLAFYLVCLLAFELLLMDHRLLIGPGARLVASIASRFGVGGIGHRDDEKRSKHKNRLH